MPPVFRSYPSSKPATNALQTLSKTVQESESINVQNSALSQRPGKISFSVQCVLTYLHIFDQVIMHISILELIDKSSGVPHLSNVDASCSEPEGRES